MSVRTVLAATYRLFKGVDNDRAGTPPDRGAAGGGGAVDRFERSQDVRGGQGGQGAQGGLGNADSGGGDTKGGTHIGF